MKKNTKAKGVRNNKTNSNLSILIRKYGLIIGLFLVIVLIKAMLSLSMYSPFIIPDELIYDTLAQNALDGHLIPKITGTVSLGYPIILSMAYILTNDKSTTYHIMLIIGTIISTSIIFPSYFILRKYCSEIISVIGALAVTLLPSLTFFSLTIMTENLFTPLFIFSLWFLIESFEKDDMKWQALASASIVYLYITRSNAVAMFAGLLIAYIYYVAVNMKGLGLISAIVKKSYLLITFGLFLLSWLIFSLDSTKSVLFAIIMATAALIVAFLIYWIVERKGDTIANVFKDRRALAIGTIIIFAIIIISGSMVIGEKSNTSLNFGSSYPVAGIATSLFQVFTSADNLLIGSIIFVNEIIYTVICSFFALTIIVFYLVFNKKKTYVRSSPISIGLVYSLTTLLVLTLTVVGLRLYTKENIFMMGRYVEPIIPAIILFSTIYLYDMKNINDKQLIAFIGFFIGTFILSLLLIEFDYSIIYGFNDYVNNPDLVFLEPLYHLPVPELWVMIYALVFMTLIYISMRNKRYISVFLAFIIISSLIPSGTLFSLAVDSGNLRMNNPINLFLNANTNKDTKLYIDYNMSDIQRKAGLNIYAFWNKGYTDYLYTTEINATSMDNNDYFISVNTLPYEYVTNDDTFKLYRL